MVIVKGEQVVDYAYPTLQVEKAVRALHELALEKDYLGAMKKAEEASRWLMEAHAALLVMEQKDK